MTTMPSSCGCAPMQALAPPPPQPRTEATPPPGPTPSPTPTTTSPSTGSLQLVNGQPGDAELLQGVATQMRASTTAAAVLDRLVATNARVTLISAAELEQRSPGAQATFSSADNVIYLSREAAAAQDLGPVATMLAHEGVHWLHDPLIDAQKQQALQQLGSVANPEAFTNEQLAIGSLATETEAHVVEARVGTELGLRTPAGHPAINADGSFRTFAQTWQALQQGTTYNPLGLQVPANWYQQVLVGQP